MPTSIVVGGIFLSSDELLGMKELSIRSLTNFVDDGRLQVNKDGARHVLAYKRKKILNLIFDFNFENPIKSR